MSPCGSTAIEASDDYDSLTVGATTGCRVGAAAHTDAAAVYPSGGPELLATAKTQRWEPSEVLKALLVEEVSGREQSALATRRTRAGFPSGKTFAAWDPALSSIPTPTQSALRTLE